MEAKELIFIFKCVLKFQEFKTGNVWNKRIRNCIRDNHSCLIFYFSQKGELNKDLLTVMLFIQEQDFECY